ncbi:NAD-glutamate dehydrogenase [Roseospira marina]|uniref:NAD-glutamate dehydrogenase n=1 Tax=Roseospira marina TaxID=140057 RepID=A0A5M6IDD6_9PROT|nr:NAD-glutamate dehydrogenase [Roseospira marina]KAA5606082.1 NAD-glutamate dehydrogenase [Roseospira marina]MBB4313052.1 glutamate dehydrogenase [Roseospira marina]MBB5086207.1 glutamate dehydrogenase [Roseospira marina]
MSKRYAARKAEQLDQVRARVAERLDPADVAAVTRFVEGYYAHVPPADMAPMDPENLYGAALAVWSFLRHRRPGEARVRVYNPVYEQHGFQSEHTVIEAVNDDMPFLVDSVTAALGALDMVVHLVIHPVVWVVRGPDGAFVGLGTREDAGAVRESVMHVEIGEVSDPATLEAVEQTLVSVLAEVRAAVEDWPAMHELSRAAAEGLKGEVAAPPDGDPEVVAEMAHFLDWVSQNHFTFLGSRDYAMVEVDGVLRAEPEPGLGILRDPGRRVFGQLRDLETLPEDVQSYVRGSAPLLITKTAMRARVHRSVPMDAIAVKRFGPDGALAGLTLLVGLFTADVYTDSAVAIPVVRRKVQHVMERSGFAPGGHDSKRLLHIMETLPRDELVQTDETKLLETALGILDLQERQRTALFLRQDEFQRFVSCLVFIPRDRFDTALRLTVQDILEADLQGKVETYSTQVDDSRLARLHFIVRTTPGAMPVHDADEIESRIAAATRSWPDHLADVLYTAKGEEQGLRLFRRYGTAFPASYRERHSAQGAVADIARIEEALTSGRFTLNLYRPIEASEHEVRFKVFQPDSSVALSDMLPVLENMGFRVIGEVPFALTPRLGDTVGGLPGEARGGRLTTVWIHDFSMRAASGGVVDIARARTPFQEAFTRVWTGELENDGFNRLVIEAGLDWRQVVILRAYARYLRQAAFTFSHAYIEQALAKHADIAARLVALFEARFDPDRPEEEAARRQREIVGAIEEALNAVTNPDEDRILRRYLNLIQATLRTNHFQHGDDGAPKPYLALKFDSRAVEDLPLPRPWVEVFVYSPRVEAIHLRGGKVARGGIRWSDRREDFRTEVLGLMKAQMVKNAVIVPVGSKGGFVVKQPPPPDAGREAVQAEGIACYKTFMRGLLDLTDTLTGDEVVPPARVRRRDGDDPYLVVAADKGTATFSDIANAVALDYGFWLRDAFASGGSNGYDHKAMGITARGAWEAVKRHFREMGRDIQSEDFTVIGVGDMSGDVFGNGMLLSPHIRLIGAFNHLHVMIDPEPDAAASLAERQRLFALPRSTWADYDAAVLSEGGRVFERRAKRVTLTPQIKARLGLRQDVVTPNDLIRALLRAEADLLWFGGIGTYVKASHESHAEVGDRANDAIRVDADDLRAKVLGEGANLGVTQRARIQFALAGGRINTDAIDNSAGVDCSDHEVNIKILLDGIVEAGDMTEKQRNALLREMTSDVAELVLRDNYLQTQAISLMERSSAGLLDHQHRLMRALERIGRLDRAVEFLPDDDEIAERIGAGRGLTRPELAVLIPYGKLWIFDEVMQSDLPEDPMLTESMALYFPRAVQTRYREQIGRHRLRREIIATYIANSMINRVGAAFVTEMIEKTGMRPADIARAYMAVREVYGLRALWLDIETLDGRVDAGIQLDLLHAINQLVGRQTQWMLRHGTWPLDVSATVTELAPAVQVLSANLDELATEETLAAAREAMAGWIEAGVPDALAAGVACLDVMAAAGDITRIAAAHERPIEPVARLYFAVGTRLGIGWLHRTAEQLENGGHWNKLAVSALAEEFSSHQRQITERVIEHGAALDDPDTAIAAWSETNPVTVERAAQLVSELRGASGGVDLAMLTVASRQFRAMAGG